MLKSIGAFVFVRCRVGGRFWEGPLWEAPLYYSVGIYTSYTIILVNLNVVLVTAQHDVIMVAFCIFLNYHLTCSAVLISVLKVYKPNVTGCTDYSLGPAAC